MIRIHFHSQMRKDESYSFLPFMKDSWWIWF